MNHFKDLISAQGVDVASVISLRELKVSVPKVIFLQGDEFSG